MYQDAISSSDEGVDRPWNSAEPRNFMGKRMSSPRIESNACEAGSFAQPERRMARPAASATAKVRRVFMGASGGEDDPPFGIASGRPCQRKPGTPASRSLTRWHTTQITSFGPRPGHVGIL